MLQYTIFKCGWEQLLVLNQNNSICKANLVSFRFKGKLLCDANTDVKMDGNKYHIYCHCYMPYLSKYCILNCKENILIREQKPNWSFFVVSIYKAR